MAAVYIRKLNTNKTINAYQCLVMYLNDGLIKIICNIPHNLKCLESRLQLKCALTYTISQ